MYTEIVVRVTGRHPGLLQHNIRLANPLDEWTRKLKVQTGKRKKTEQTHADIAEIEFFGSLYLNDKGRPIIPATWFEGAIIDASKRAKLGKIAKAAILVADNAVLKFSGPQKTAKRQTDPTCQLAAMVNVSGKRVLRTRPLFRDWSTEVVYSVDLDIMKMDEFTEALKCASGIGIGDYRPRYGRFDAEIIG